MAVLQGGTAEPPLPCRLPGAEEEEEEGEAEGVMVHLVEIVCTGRSLIRGSTFAKHFDYYEYLVFYRLHFSLRVALPCSVHFFLPVLIK